MFEIAIAIGIYSYLVLTLGLFSKLSLFPLAATTVIFWGIYLSLQTKKEIKVNLKGIKLIFTDRLILLLLIILFAQGILNLIGALGPELSFDALWYHLTLAKLYVKEHRVFHIPGGLLYYSAMPRLTEMLYTAALIFKDEILAKLIHFSFGVLSAIILFKWLRSHLNSSLSFLGVAVFYTLLVVGWQSTTAYVDLARTFFELLGLVYFLHWLKEGENWLTKSGLMMGLALCVKHLSLGTFLIFILLILFFGRNKISSILKFSSLALGVTLPWYLLAFFNTGDPFYPLLSNWFKAHQIGDWQNFLLTHRPLAFITSFWTMTFHLDNLLSPIFLILLPSVLVKIWRQEKVTKAAALYFLLGYFYWFLTPPSTARYLLPFIPALVFVCLKVLSDSPKAIQKVAMGAAVIGCLLNLGSRAMATPKFLPVVFGRQTKAEFLTHNLNFDFGDFYDVDGYFQENITAGDLVLVDGIHNLYYVDFPFVHESWAEPGTNFTHVLVKDKALPKKYGQLELIYENQETKVKLYKNYFVSS